MTAPTGIEVSASVQPMPMRSRFNVAVERIVDQTGCSRTQAKKGIRFIVSMAGKAITGERCGTVGTHHLTNEEMGTSGYEVMDSIMPHTPVGTPPLEGSAHQAVVAVVSEQLPSVYNVTHANSSGRRQDCTVTVNVGTV